MNQQARSHLFDGWAAYYDQSVRDAAGFPFDGYEQVLDEITRIAEPRPGMKVLDLGIGTGNLAKRFAAGGCEIWGIDFSAEMLAIAAEKLSTAVMVQADLLGEWPPEVDRRFDRIVSSYVLHEFDLATKTELLQRLTKRHLTGDGRIVIGDIAFPSVAAREQARQRLAHQWDEEEYYWAADEANEACVKAGMSIGYWQVSSCGGVFAIEPGS